MAEGTQGESLGGNVTSVIRVGMTVRRGIGPWSPSVQQLLRHLEEVGFDGAPRFLGVDEHGREILSYLPGEVGHYPLPETFWSPASLTAAARLLRRFHDATVSFVAPIDAVWQMADSNLPVHEVICHNDAAPHNVVFVNGLPVAWIDFDTAGPGPRIRDVAYSAYRFVPLAEEAHARSLGFHHPNEVAGRLRAFCDAYGLEDRSLLLATVEERLEELVEWIIEHAEAGNPAYRRHVEEGHLSLYEGDLAFLSRHRVTLVKALG